MALLAILGAGVVGFTLMVATALANSRVLRTRDGENLDGDSLAARLTWSGDLVLVVGVSATAAWSVVTRARAEAGLSAPTVVAGVISLLGCAFVTLQATHHEAEYINRYPESFYQLISRHRSLGPKTYRWATPGALTALVLSVALAVTSVVAAGLRDDPSTPTTPAETVTDSVE